MAEVAKIFASVNEGEYSPTGLTFVMDINQFPVAKVSIAPNADSPVRTPISDEIVARIAELQAQRLAGRDSTDVTIYADDGVAGTVDYRGFLSAPILGLSRTNTVEQFSTVGMDAYLDALDLSIYKAGYITERRETGSQEGEQLDPIPAAQSGDLVGTLQGVTEIMVGNYETVLESEVRETAKQMLEIRHGINTGGDLSPLDMWYQILENSDVTFQSWEKAFSHSDTIAILLADAIKKQLLQRNPGFWNKVRGLMAAFQMYYVPSFEGVGRFRRADTKVSDDSAATLQVSAADISLADGSPRILQPGGVVMMGRGFPGERAGTTPNPILPRAMAYAPNPLQPGFIHEETPPFWLLRKDGMPILGSEVEGSTSDSNLNLSLAELQRRKERGDEYQEKGDDVREGVMTEMCEVMFAEMQLAHSTVQFTMPLNFTLNDHVGSRVNVEVLGKNGQPAGAFSAFVSGITHNVVLTRGKQLDSRTHLRCTHAKYD